MEKLQWKTIHKNGFNRDCNILEMILTQNGVKIEDISNFLHPTKKLIHNPFLMKNMEKAVDIIHKHVELGSRVFIKPDCDVDGNSSFSVLYQFLQELNPSLQIDYKPNYQKHHGLTFEDLADSTRNKYGLIIIPDASMTVQDAKTITTNFNADIVCLDHHLIEMEDGDCYTNYCVAVNCTDGQYPNPYLSGVGVVQKMIEGYIKKYDAPKYLETEYLDLVSLGIAADAMDLRSLENRYYVLEGMKKKYWNNEFINELVERKQEDMPFGRTIKSMTWYIAPLINGCIRYGKPKEQDEMYKAILGVNENKEYQPRRKHRTDPKPEVEIQSIQKYMARVCENIKSRQDNEVRKFCDELEARIVMQGRDKNTVVFVDGTDILTSGTVTGLCAGKLTNRFFRPVVIMRERDNETFGGSMRGYGQCPIDDTKGFLEQADVTVMGHSQAGGVEFQKKDLNKIIATCNQLLPPDQMSTCYTVDWELPANQLTREDVLEVAENYAIFGNTVPEPLFAITGIKLNAAQIKGSGQNNLYINFTYNGVSFAKRFCKHYEYDQLTLRESRGFNTTSKDLIINVIGKFILNSYNGENMPQVEIIAFDSVENKEVKPVEVFEQNVEDDWERGLESMGVHVQIGGNGNSSVDDFDFDW